MQIAKIIIEAKNVISKNWKIIIGASLAIFIIFILTASLMQKRQSETSKRAALKELDVKKVYMKVIDKTNTMSPKPPKTK